MAEKRSESTESQKEVDDTVQTRTMEEHYSALLQGHREIAQQNKNISKKLEDLKQITSNSEVILFTEVHRMHTELLKESSEQVKMLQLRFEENAKLLEKLLKEQQRKTGKLMTSSSFSPSQEVLLPNDGSIPDSQNMSKNEASMSQPSSSTKNKAFETEDESPKKRRRLEIKAEPEDPKW